MPFDVKADYGPYVDGKPRLDGTRGFLASRGITLPDGDPADGPDAETVVGLATRKNELVHEKIRDRRRRRLRRAPCATCTPCATPASRPPWCRRRRTPSWCCRSPGSTDLIDHRVDGVVAKQRNLPGKPAPDTFLAAAADLGVPKEQAVVFEDALAGVESGHAGGFGFVVGVDRLGHADALREARRGRRRHRPRRPPGTTAGDES